MNRYLVVVEEAETNFSAYVPDVPTCFATGESRDEAFSNLRKALQVHMEALVRVGLSVPQPRAVAEYIELPGHSGSSSESDASPQA